MTFIMTFRVQKTPKTSSEKLVRHVAFPSGSERLLTRRRAK